MVNEHAIIIAISLMVMDILSGLLKSLATSTFTSSIMRKGLYHKIGEILVIMLSGIMECAALYVDVSVNIPLLSATLSYIIAMEAGSILENVKSMNRFLELRRSMNDNKKRN